MAVLNKVRARCGVRLHITLAVGDVLGSWRCFSLLGLVEHASNSLYSITYGVTGNTNTFFAGAWLGFGFSGLVHEKESQNQLSPTYSMFMDFICGVWMLASHINAPVVSSMCSKGNIVVQHLRRFSSQSAAWGSQLLNSYCENQEDGLILWFGFYKHHQHLHGAWTSRRR